jgi:hypothetical protein
MINPDVALDIGGFIFQYPAPFAAVAPRRLTLGITPKKKR